MVFETKKQAEVYKKCKGVKYDKAHIVIPATVNGKQVGWMLRLKDAVRYF